MRLAHDTMSLAQNMPIGHALGPMRLACEAELKILLETLR